MNLTESQLAAIDHRGSNLLVSASAGSGKTEVLARRCVALIADPEHPCGVERLLVVTFTRAAAAELRVRVARMLRGAADQSRDARLRDHLRRQELLIDTADIGTIDAWCGRIVRAHSAEAGVDGEFAVLAEVDARLLRRDVLDELFEWIYASSDAPAVAARDWLRRGAKPDDGFLRRLILKLNEFREHVVDVERWLAGQQTACAQSDDALRAEARTLLAASLAEECAFEAGQLAEVFARPESAPLAACLAPLREQLSAWSRKLGTPRTGPAALSDVVQEISAWKVKKPRGLSAGQEGVFEDVKERWLKKRLQERWSPRDVQNIVEAAPAAAKLVATLLDLEACYQERLAAAKRSRAVCEFGDVLRLTLDLLGQPCASGPRQPTEIAHRLRERYEHILVDEYQDTSPVQADILRLVTRVEPGRSNRFMVGDVKQSIYGFRQAEPRLFADLAQAFEAGATEGRVQYLSDNFRSHPELLAGLNRVFAALLDPRLGGTAFAEAERLRAGRTEIANPTLDGQPRIELHVFDLVGRENSEAQEDDAIPLERIEREALVAAELIRDLVARGVQVPDRAGPDGPTLRPLQLSDIVILLRAARGKTAAVARVLRKAGIPCLTAGRDALFEVPEVADLCNVLSLLVNRRQDVPLAAYLRGPLVGLSAAELLRIRLASPRADFYHAVAQWCGWSDEGERARAPVQPGDALADRVRAALEQLDRWNVAAREEDLPELLRRILHDSGLLFFAAGLRDGEHRVGLLRTIENFAADFARQGQHGVAEFVAYLEDLAAAELEPVLPVAAGQDAVRLMTIHAAKGLEFPVVFLLNAGARFNTRRVAESLQCDEAHGVGLRFYDHPARADLASARHHLIKCAATQRELEEELRLLYVATTRARERLYVLGHCAAGAWERACVRFAAPTVPPLASRLAVGNMLDWLLMAVPASGVYTGGQNATPLVHVVTHAEKLTQPSEAAPAEAAPVTAGPWTADDDAWLSRSEALLEARVDSSSAALPAVMSVSALKELAAATHDADTPHQWEIHMPTLRLPAFVAQTEPAGRDLGLACHRLLEHADFSGLDTDAAVRAQVDAFVAAGRLSPTDAVLVPIDDIVWFGGSAAGRLATAHAAGARREMPFVYALPLGPGGERTIVRGVIDCLLETDAGLIILDYKTDQVRDEKMLQERVAGYTIQLQLYAQAAGGILARPVVRALLVFLRARQIVEVPCATPDLVQVLARLGSAVGGAMT